MWSIRLSRDVRASRDTIAGARRAVQTFETPLIEQAELFDILALVLGTGMSIQSVRRIDADTAAPSAPADIRPIETALELARAEERLDP